MVTITKKMSAVDFNKRMMLDDVKKVVALDELKVVDQEAVKGHFCQGLGRGYR